MSPPNLRPPANDRQRPMNMRSYKPTLVTAWSLYAQGIPTQAGTVQREETQKAFYSGALAALKLIDDLVCSGAVVSGATHEQLRVLESEVEAKAPDFASLLFERRAR